jgi:hypothetical protein
MTVALGDQASAEIVSEPGASNPAMGRLVVYFLQADRATPLPGAPTGVTAKIRSQTGEKSVSLQPEAEAKSSGTARYVSSPGEFGDDQITGELTATIDGVSQTARFVAR